jgi:hypothetical protein
MAHFSTFPLYNPKTNETVLTLVDAQHPTGNKPQWETTDNSSFSSNYIQLNFKCPSKRKGSTYPLSHRIYGDQVYEGSVTCAKTIFEFPSLSQPKNTKYYVETNFLVELGVLDKSELLTPKLFYATELVDRINKLVGVKFKAKVYINPKNFWAIDLSKITLTK